MTAAGTARRQGGSGIGGAGTSLDELLDDELDEELDEELMLLVELVELDEALLLDEMLDDEMLDEELDGVPPGPVSRGRSVPVPSPQPRAPRAPAPERKSRKSRRLTPPSTGIAGWGSVGVPGGWRPDDVRSGDVGSDDIW